MSDTDFDAPKGNVAEQIVNGDVSTHPVIQDTKAEFKGLANGPDDADSEQPYTFYHNFFSEIFTWKYPKATGLVFTSTISLIFAFHFINVLRYVFKGAYMLFFSVAALEIASKPFSREAGLVSSLRPKRYYTVPRDSLERLFVALHELSNFFVLELQRVVFAENIFATIAAFVASFFGYFLIKYIPLWGLMLLATVTAFTAPLIYLNNQEFIDEKIHQAQELINAQLETGKKMTEKYAGDAAVKAREAALELADKVRGYTGGAAHKSPKPVKKEDSTSFDGASDEAPTTKPATHDILSDAPSAPSAPLESDFPEAPKDEPGHYSHEHGVTHDATEPLLA